MPEGVAVQGTLTDFHAKYLAHELTKRCSSDSIEKLAPVLADAQVDLNPHQVEAALFAFRSPFSKGAILADEVGLGKTIARNLQVVTPLRRDKIVQGRTQAIDGVTYIVDDDVVRKQFGKYDKKLGDRRCFYEDLVKYKGQEKKDEIDRALEAGELFLEERPGGVHVVCRRTPVDEASSKLYSIVKALSEEGKKDLEALDMADVYDYPKSVELVRQLVRSATSDGDIVLDFFAGSGTTAHAVFDLDTQDDCDRSFILVQLPEPTGRSDYPTIADITKERVRRVIKKLNTGDSGNLPVEGSRKPDRGFRVYKLAESNFNPWNAEVPHETPALEKQLELHIDHIRAGRTTDDLLYEILLKSGYPLTTPVETLQLAGKAVHSVAGGALLVCLERELSLDLIRAMAEKKPSRVVCLDEGFAGNDQLKANAVQIFKTKGVTAFKTV